VGIRGSMDIMRGSRVPVVLGNRVLVLVLVLVAIPMTGFEEDHLSYGFLRMRHGSISLVIEMSTVGRWNILYTPPRGLKMVKTSIARYSGQVDFLTNIII